MNNTSQSLLPISCLFLLLLFNMSPVNSQSIWTGDGDGTNWSDAANWDNGVPAQIGDAEIPTGMTATIGSSLTVDWTIGDLIGGGTLINDGEINLNDGFYKFLNENTTLINNNLMSHNNGNLFINDGHLINEGILVFTADNDNITFSAGIQHDITNNGSIIKDGGAGTTNINPNLVNNGTLYALTGELRLSLEGTYKTGTNLLTAAGAKLSFYSGTHALDGDIIGHSDGVIEMRTTMDIQTTATIDIENQGIECTLCTFTGGGSLSFLDRLSMTLGFNKFLNGLTEIIIVDTMEMINGNFFINDGHIINNGVVLFSADNDNITFSAGTIHDLTNNGSIIKDGGASTSLIQVNLINNNTLHPLTGELRMTGGGTYNTGTKLLTAAGAKLSFYSGTHILDGDIIGHSDGILEMRTSMDIPTTASMDIENRGIECTLCTFTGGGSLSFLDRLSMTSGFNKFINGLTEIVIADTMEIIDGNLFVNDGHIINNGVVLFSADNDNITFSAGTQHDLTNNGSIVKDGGTSTSNINSNLNNVGLIVAKTGIIDLNTNMFSPVASALYAGVGEIDVAGIPASDIVSGMMIPGIGFFGNGFFDPGILTIDGDVDTARFKLDIYGPPTVVGTDFDQVIFDDDIDVVDSIDIDLWYRPMIGDIYDVVLADNIVTCSLPDTINTFHDGCDHRFEVICQADKIQLKYVGISPGIDYDALMALYNATDGPNWTDNTNWGTGCPCDTDSPWAKVACQGGRVTKLFLNSNNLVGTIPPELGDLHYLRTLNLSGNNLTGPVPSAIGQLSRLEVFHAFGSGITGAIPNEISQCPVLRDMRLHNNHLSGALPIDFGNLINLEVLMLQDNDLGDSLRINIGNMASLETLYLYNNQFNGWIPPTIGNLSNLKKLRLSGNQLCCQIPTGIGQLSNLDELWLNNNLLSGGIPLEMMTLTNLVQIRLQNNPNLDGCYDTRLQLIDGQWGTFGSHSFISAGTQMANWDSFVTSGSGTCCLASINENCTSGPCDFFDGAFWQAEGSVTYSGDHRVNNSISLTLNSSDLVELSDGFEVVQGGELDIPMTGCETSSFINSSMGVTDIDGNEYDTVHIGDQVWMAENLRVTRYNDGTQIPEVTSVGQWNNLSTAAWCWYDNDSSYEMTYGKLYNWFAVHGASGLCPNGWNVPTDADWSELINYLGGNTIAGGKLKSTSPLWDAPNGGATNESKFNALPGGQRWAGGDTDLGNQGDFWSRTQSNTFNAWRRLLSANNSTVFRFDPQKERGHSVRCLQGLN